jgi:DNA (cytosine-5)-methyltransferase 1
LNFSYKWNLEDLKKVKPNGLKVFSCFSGSGGSTMGYKMAGYNTLGALEIDKEMLETYVSNLKPKLPILDSIQNFKKRSSFPEELLNLDILDGSPPCSVFSESGHVHKKWGAEFKFREGQVKQRLDNLFFDFIDLAEKLKPKMIVAENVRGMIKGKTKGFTKAIIKAFKDIGYNIQLFNLNGADMGLPQKRVRVFFIASRAELGLPKLKLNFKEPFVCFREIRNDNDGGKELTPYMLNYWKSKLPNEINFYSITERLKGKRSLFNYSMVKNNAVLRTIMANGGDPNIILYDRPRYINFKEITLASSFPSDYKFKNNRHGIYCMGMSVPPLMIYKISREIALQCFNV